MRLIIISIIFICLSFINSTGLDSLITNSFKEIENPTLSLKINYGRLFNDNSGFKNLFKEAGLIFDQGSSINYYSISFYGEIPWIKNLCEGMELLLFNGDGTGKNDSLVIKYPSSLISLLIYFQYLFEIYNDLTIYPFCKFGLGGGGLNVEVNNNIDDIKFNDIFTKLTPNESIYGTSGVVIAGFGAEYLLSSQVNYNKKNSLHIGFDVGYLFSGPQNWNYIGYKIIDMPSYLYKGFILTLSLTYKQ